MAQVLEGDTMAASGTARRVLASIDTVVPTPTDARFAAPALVSLGREDDALTILERARPRGAQLWFYMRSRDFDRMRTAPRFSALSASVMPN